LNDKTKRFWIKITPLPGVGRSVLHGSLIRADSVAQIRDEAVEFVLENLKQLEMDWMIEVLRPSGAPPVCAALSVAAFLRRVDPAELPTRSERGWRHANEEAKVVALLIRACAKTFAAGRGRGDEAQCRS